EMEVRTQRGQNEDNKINCPEIAILRSFSQGKAHSLAVRCVFCAALLMSVASLAPAAAQQAAPSGRALGGIQSASMLEVKPDADQQPGYAEQTNAERAKVQPANNARVWRQVNSGEPGYSSLPASEAPEAGVLIQRFVQYPGSQY